jgi:c-di-GMP-binding flagellar brake protein YcgR
MDKAVARPERHDHVTLHLPCCEGESHHSRIEAVDGDLRRVASPLLHPHGVPGEPFPAGTEITLGWHVGGGGWAEIASRLEDEATHDHLNWRVVVSGEPAIVQRREYARVTHVAMMRIRVDGTWLDTKMVDLSEGGLSCPVPAGHVPEPAAPVEVEVTIASERVVLDGDVVRSVALPGGESLAAVRFAAVDSKTSDRIRREVFALQLQQRARGAA